jgi:hypothetical protein
METQGKTTSSASQSNASARTAEAVHTAREQGRQMVEQGKQVVEETVDQAKQKAGELAGQAKQQAISTVDSRKSEAVHRLDGVAQALRQTSTQLQNQQDPTIARYAEAAAGQVERFSRYLDQRDINQLMSEARSLAQRQPEVFVAGALALGFLFGRFLKSSSMGDRRYYDERYGYGDRYGYGEQYGYSDRYGASDYYGSGEFYGSAGSYERVYGSESYGTSRGFDQGSDLEYNQPRGGQFQGQGYGGYGQSSGYRQGSTAAAGSSFGQTGGERSTTWTGSSAGQQGSQTGSGSEGMGNYSGTGTQTTGSSAQSGIRTPADPTGIPSVTGETDEGRSNQTREEGRQRDTGTSAHGKGS